MTLGFLAFAWLLGLAGAAFTDADPWASVAAAGALAATSFAVRPRASTLVLIALGAASICAAAWRYEATFAQDMPAGIARLNDGDEVRLRGLVNGEPEDSGSAVLYRLTVRELLDGGRWQAEGGGILMRVASYPRHEYGDVLELRGTLETPPRFDDFDYREYLSRQGIGSLMEYPRVRVVAHGEGSRLKAALIDVRGRLSTALSDVLPEPEASLAAGVLLGRRVGVPRELSEDMKATGTSHLLAVSGQNVTLVAGLMLAGLAWMIGRRQAALLALAGVAVYSLLVGAEPSVVRAAIMGGLYVVAAALGRQSSGVIALAFAGAAMTAADPQIVHDLSFQLSFASALGIMTLAPVLVARIEAFVRRWPVLDEFPLSRPVYELAGVTLSAIAFTLPISAINFQRVSLVAPFANLLAVPAFLAVAFTAAVAALAGAVLPGAGEALGWIAWPPAAYMIAAIRLSADLPLASLEVRGLGTGHAVAYYAALALGLWLMAPRRAEVAAPAAPVAAVRVRGALPTAGLVLVLALASVLLWLAATTPANGRLSVTFLDVGQGEAILVEGPRGNRVLIDGGPSERAITEALGRSLPFYDRRVDLVVLTHSQSDHVGGLPAVIRGYDVEAALAASPRTDSAGYREWRRALTERDVPLYEPAPGQTVDLGEGARLSVIYAPLQASGANDTSLVIRLTMGRASFLLTGDIESSAERALIRSVADLRAVVYKVAHHGSDTSSSAAFLSSVDPAIDVISVGRNNRYGHPSPAVIERLDGDLVFRTDVNGDVTMSTDGRRMRIETSR